MFELIQCLTGHPPAKVTAATQISLGTNTYFILHNCLAMNISTALTYSSGLYNPQNLTKSRN